jgi:hypothetical protein
MMKKIIMLAGILAVLALPAMALAQAAPPEGTHGYFTISDLTEGSIPTVVNATNVANTTFATPAGTPFQGNEYITVTGVLTGVAGGADFLHQGERAVILTEPGTTIASDVIILTASPVTQQSPGSAIYTQTYTFQFASDTASVFTAWLGIAQGLSGSGNGFTTFAETGLFQDVSQDLPAGGVGGGLDAEDAFSTVFGSTIDGVQVRSDVEVPLPPSVLLMGSGLLGLGLVGWRRRKA